MNQTAEELESKLTELEESIPSLSNISNAFWKTTPQCSVLIKESPAPKPVKITSTAKRFTPDGPFYLDSILIYSDTPEKLNSDLTLIIKPLNEPAKKYTIDSSSTLKFGYTYLRKFCEWFEIHSDTKIFKPKLTKISIYGADTIQLSNLTADIRTVIDLKNTIEKFKDTSKKEHQELLKQIQDLQASFDDIALSIETEKALQKELVTSNAKLTDNYQAGTIKLDFAKWELEQSRNALTQAENNFEQLKEQAATLNKKIPELELELKKLATDKNLISDEYGPYVKEGRSQAATYVAIISLPLLAIIFSVYELYMGASKLINTNYNSTTEIVGSFVLRIPFAAVFGLAIYYSWRLTSAIIQKIFTIHSDRLTLAKLLVLAREAVHSSAKNLPLSSETVFQEQLRFKVEVLKSHLSKDLGNNFEYNPTNIPKTTPSSPSADAVNDTNIDEDNVETSK